MVDGNKCSIPGIDMDLDPGNGIAGRQTRH